MRDALIPEAYILELLTFGLCSGQYLECYSLLQRRFYRETCERMVQPARVSRGGEGKAGPYDEKVDPEPPKGPNPEPRTDLQLGGSFGVWGIPPIEPEPL